MARHVPPLLPLALSALVVACTGAEKDVEVPQPKPIAVIPGAAEVQLDDDVLIERDARVHAKIDLGLRERWLRTSGVDGYEIRVELRDLATGVAVGHEWRTFDPFKVWK